MLRIASGRCPAVFPPAGDPTLLGASLLERLDAGDRARFLRCASLTTSSVLLAAVVGMSRVSLGVHCPDDVLVGQLLAALTYRALPARLSRCTIVLSALASRIVNRIRRAGGGLVALTLLSLPPMLSIDLALFHRINGLAGHVAWLDALLIACAKDAPVVFAVVLLGCWATWRPNLQRAAALAGVAALVALGIGQLVGMMLPRARPYQVTTATVLVLHAPDTSFPSDHAIMAFAVTLVLAGASRRLGGWLALFSAVVLFARVYIGVHYPTDVIGGALLGSLVAWGIMRSARASVVAHRIDATFALLRRLRIAAPVPGA